MTAAVTHVEGDRILLDAVRERMPPFSPEKVAQEFAGFFRSYGISTITGDRYGGEWPREPFRKHGISTCRASVRRAKSTSRRCPC